MAKFAVIIPAAGKSERMGGTDKLNIRIGGKTVLEKAKEAFSGFDQVIVVGRGEVPGGKTRQESVYNGLCALDKDVDFVLIHDGARPFVSSEVIERVRQALLSGSRAVVPCVKPKDTVRNRDCTLDRSELFLVQTPQGFDAGLLKQCFEQAIRDGFDGTDDASVAEHCGVRVDIVEGDYANIKITTADDLPKAPVYFGSGYDLHRLVPGRPLMLGCTKIEFEKGLLGHSDADVLAHAIADAMLGGAALGDIGKHFPDTSEETKGMSGTEILQKTEEILKMNGYSTESVDGTLIAQRPKIAPYVQTMRANIARAIGIDVSRVSVKATTEEGMGPTGEGLAMAAYATATVKENR